MDDSSGIAWNTMPSSAGFVGPQYAAWRFKTSRRLGSNSSTPNGPVPMARVSSSLPSPAAPFGMTPLYLPPRLMRNVAAGAWRTKDRKSTRLNSSHLVISYAVFCLKKKKNLHRLLHYDHCTSGSTRDGFTLDPASYTANRSAKRDLSRIAVSASLYVLTPRAPRPAT